MSFCFTLGGRQAREGKGFPQGHRAHQCSGCHKIQSTHSWPRATLAISLKLPWRLTAQRPRLDFRRDRQENISLFWGEENPNVYVRNKGGKKSNYLWKSTVYRTSLKDISLNKLVLLSPPSTRRIRSSGRLEDLPKVTRLVTGRVRI